MLLVARHLEVPRLNTLQVGFDEAHPHIFEAILAGEFTSPTVSA